MRRHINTHTFFLFPFTTLSFNFSLFFRFSSSLSLFIQAKDAEVRRLRDEQRLKEEAIRFEAEQKEEEERRRREEAEKRILERRRAREEEEKRLAGLKPAQAIFERAKQARMSAAVTVTPGKGNVRDNNTNYGFVSKSCK